MSTRRFSILGALAAALLGSSAPAFASRAPQDPEDLFFQAYYLEHEQGDLEGALELYRKAARRGSGELRAKASRAAEAVVEDLVAGDFARLMPADTIAYIEIDRPGARVEALLSQLGLLGSTGAVTEAARYKISPLLVRSLLGLRGAALAVTEIDPQGGPPNAVAVFHPGDLDVVRGLIETAVPSGGSASEPIAGHATWSIEGHVFLTLTQRLVIASPDRGLIEGVLQRLSGDASDSLASNPAVADAMQTRGEDLLFFCINAEPVMPMLQAMIDQQSQQDPELAMAVAFLDVPSLRALSGRIAIGEKGLGLDLALDLAEGHHNLAFNLLRKPTLERRTLGLVPDQAAFFLATSLNEPRAARPVSFDAGSGAGEDRIVTAMDFGRELFGNIVDVAIYGLAPSADSAAGPLPEIAAVVRTNDAAQSRALWKFVLGLASQSSGSGSMEPEHVRIAGVDAESYVLQGVPVYLVSTEGELVISPSRSAISRSLEARKSGRSVLDDDVFRDALQTLSRSSTFALVCNPGRTARMAQNFMSARDRAEMMSIASMLESTLVSLCVEHSSTRLALRARVAGIPDVSGLVAQVIDRERHGAGHSVVQHVAAPAEHAQPVVAAAPAGDLGSLRQQFEELATEPDQHAQAATLGARILELAGDDPTYLNDFAWALLTEERYHGAHAELAVDLARRANDLTGWKNWALVDTMALAVFEQGDVGKAIELEEKAVELAGDDPRAGEALKALEHFRAAARDGAAIVGR